MGTEAPPPGVPVLQAYDSSFAGQVKTAELLEGQAVLFAGVHYRSFACHKLLGVHGHFADQLRREGYRAVLVSMDDIPVRHFHAEHLDGAAERDDMEIDVRRPQAAGEKQYVFRQLADIAYTTVGNDSPESHRPVDPGIEFTPERTVLSVGIIDVLHDADLRPAHIGIHVFVVVQALLLQFCRA